MKIKIYIAISLNIISLLFLLPIFIGTGCNGLMDAESDIYKVTGSCKYGLMELYYVPKNASNNDKYTHIKAINMEFYDNRAIYIYHLDMSDKISDFHKIKKINKIKFNRYYQFNITNHDTYIMLKSPDGSPLKLKYRDENIKSLKV